MNKPTIICVDDEKIVLSSLKDQLKTSLHDEYDIEVLDSGQKALDSVKELLGQKIELPLIIADQVMPGMKGDELLTNIHKLSPRTLSILLTGQADARAVGNAVNSASLYRYMSKPWEREDLILTIREALRSYFNVKTLEEQNQEMLSVQHQLQILNKKLEEKVKLFNQFVPDHFLKVLNLDKNKDYIELGYCSECNMSILFADVRSFTLISDTLSAKETFQYIFNFFSHVTPFISKYQGFVDKFIGDAMMALFMNADQALSAAIQIQQSLNIAIDQSLPFQLGVGVNTGNVVLGTVGGSDHMETTVIGDAVNVAARTENLTRIYNTPLLITGSTFKELKDPSTFLLRHIDKSAIRGKHESVEIYEVLDALPPSIRDKKVASLDLFQQAKTCFEALNYVEARKLFSMCLKFCPEDDVSRYYINRIES